MTWVNATRAGRDHAGAMTAMPSKVIDAAPEPMSAVDRAWLEMDGPHNPMVVASIMELEGVADVNALARTLAGRLLAQRRFRQRVVTDGGHYFWLEDEPPRLGYHVQVRPLAGPRTELRLQAAVAAELSRELDRALPLWRICLFAHQAGRVTVLFRAHHAIADGVALMRGLLQLADGAQGPAPGPAPAPRDPPHGPLGGMIRRLEEVNATLENLTELALDDLQHPERLSRHMSEARRTLLAISRVFLLPDDNPRRFRVAPGGLRAVAWTSRLSFAAVRRHARAQGVTINDVFLAALAGAFGRYLRRADGHVPEGQNLRISVPVNLRADGDGTVGNAFGLLLADLPVGLEGAHARLDVVAERMARLKGSPEARAVLGSLAAAGHLPPAAEKPLVNFIGGKAAAVVSNLPGPKRVLRLGGARIANIVFWPPQAGAVGIGISMLSYAGHVTVGVSADTAQLARPQLLVDDFCAELAAMLGRAPFARIPTRTARSATGE